MEVFKWLVNRARKKYLTKDAMFRYVHSRLIAYNSFKKSGKLFD